MANQTINYGLTKPLVNENYNVADQNGNMDIIDTKLKENADATAGKETPAGAQAKADEVQTNLGTHLAETTNAHGGLVASSEIATVATANKILKLNASSKLPASITGDADTIDGLHASVFAQAITGTYVGNGTLNRTISIGFTPKIIFITEKYAAPKGLNVTGHTGKGNVEITTNGFIVHEGYVEPPGLTVNTNTNGEAYAYLAFK